MGSLSDDLDRFLKTDGIRIIMDAGGICTEPLRLLTEEELRNFQSIDISSMNAEELEDLRFRLEDLLDEPEEQERLSEIEDFLDKVTEYLDELEDENG